MVSLAYYLRVLAAIWMRPDPAHRAGGAGRDAGDRGRLARGRRRRKGREPLPASGRRRHCSARAATIVFGVAPSPLVDWASDAGQSILG